MFDNIIRLSSTGRRLPKKGPLTVSDPEFSSVGLFPNKSDSVGFSDVPESKEDDSGELSLISRVSSENILGKVVTGKSLRRKYKDNWEIKKTESFKLWSNLIPNSENGDSIYWKIVELTLLLQNDYAKTVPESQLSASSKSRLDKHPNARYNLTYQMVIASIIASFNELATETEDELKKYAEALCIICTHKSETLSRSRIFNALAKNTMLTGSASKLLNNFGVKLDDSVTTAHFKVVKERLLKGTVVYFNQSVDQATMTEESASGPMTKIPEFSNAKSNFNIIMHHIHDITKYTKFLSTIKHLFPNEDFTPLIDQLDAKKQYFEDCYKSMGNEFDVEIILLIDGVKLEHIKSKIAGLPNAPELRVLNYYFTLAHIETQKEELNRCVDHTIKVHLPNGLKCDFITGRAGTASQPQEIEPSIIRSAFPLLKGMGNKDHINNPINLYKHTIELTFPDSSDSINYTIIRTGTLHSLEAAKSYLKAMVALLPEPINNDQPIYIADNRLLLDIDPTSTFHEAPLLKEHRQYMNDALNALKNATEDDPKWAVIFRNVIIMHLNFQDKKIAVASPSDRHHDSLSYLIGIFDKKISQLEGGNSEHLEEKIEFKQEEQINIDKIKFCWKLLNDVKNDASNHVGVTALNLAFLVQYLCRNLGVLYSEGCKSNKDRGGMKKMRDEIFFVKLMLTNDYAMSFAEFFTINENDLTNFAFDVAVNNTSAFITRLNTGTAGNKAVAGHEKLLGELGLSSSFLKGNQELMKNVGS